MTTPRPFVIPAKAGIQFDFAFDSSFGRNANANGKWIPAFAGMTKERWLATERWRTAEA